MARIKRFRWLFFTFRDELELDLLALFRAEVSTRSSARLFVVSLLTGRLYPCEPDTLRSLAQVPPDQWLAEEEICRQLSVEPEHLDLWVRQGLLLSDRDDPELARLRSRAETLDSHQWHPHAAFFYFMLRGPDEEPSFEEYNYQAIAENVTESAKSFVERYGPPPEAIYSRSSQPGIELPMVEKQGGLYEALLRRRSVRAFDLAASLTLENLATLLYYVFGFHGYTRLCPEVTLLHRTSPSGGSLHPVEVYPLLIRVEGMACGLYHYDAGRHALEPIQELDSEHAREMVTRFTRGQTHASSAAAIFIMTARFHRNFWKYRRSDRTYTVTLMDAAHLSQSFYLVAAELGLAAFFSAAIHPQSIEEALSLDGYQEGPIAICACGSPPTEGDDQGLDFKPFIPRQTKI